MPDQERKGETRTEFEGIEIGVRREKVDANALSPGVVPTAPADNATTANKLSPEEQMALFAKELKENDWGHQPC